MSFRYFSIGLTLVALAAWPVLADVSYQQTTTLTGGSMYDMMKRFSSEAREPQVSKVLLKGNRMATVSPKSMSIVDLDAATITTVLMDKKTYSVITFEEMKQAMEKAAQMMGGPQQQAPAQVKASAKRTGQTKAVAGMPAEEMIMTVTMEPADPKQPSAGISEIVSDMWLAKNVPGQAEMNAFFQRMASKMDWAPGMAGPMMGRSDLAKAFAEVYRETAKTGGFAVMQTTRMSGTSMGMPGMGPMPSAGDVAGDAATGAAASRMGRFGGLAGAGGLGGLGRRKKAEEQKEQAPPAQQQAPEVKKSLLLESVTEYGAFSTAPVDASQLAVPAGFKQEESPLKKMGGR